MLKNKMYYTYFKSTSSPQFKCHVSISLPQTKASFEPFKHQSDILHNYTTEE